jgi:hypothetical protein
LAFAEKRRKTQGKIWGIKTKTTSNKAAEARATCVLFFGFCELRARPLRAGEDVRRFPSLLFVFSAAPRLGG